MRDEVICWFARLHPKRMELAYILSETQERKGGIKIQRIPWGSMPPIPLRSLPSALIKQIGQYLS